ncbi:hypothetical protein GCM10020295_01710 [Streptomyces cinereospinus]
MGEAGSASLDLARVRGFLPDVTHGSKSNTCHTVSWGEVQTGGQFPFTYLSAHYSPSTASSPATDHWRAGRGLRPVRGPRTTVKVNRRPECPSMSHAVLSGTAAGSSSWKT